MLMNNFSIIVRYCKIFTERRLSAYDLGMPEQVILMYLSKKDQVNQDTIARYFIIDKSAIAKTLGKLESKGFIERYTNPDNKRENLVSLTQKGRDIMDYMRKILEEWNRILLKDISEEDIRSMERIADIMEGNIVDFLNQEVGNSYENGQ